MTAKGTVKIGKVFPVRSNSHKGKHRIVPNSLLSPPGIHRCPRCEELAGRLDELVADRRLHDAGGHHYWWTSFIGWIVCLACGFYWSENFS